MKQYIHSEERHGEIAQDPANQVLTTSAAPKAIINYIHGGPVDEKYNSKQNRQRLLRAASVRERVSSLQTGLTNRGTPPIDEIITFPPVDLNWVLQPHENALILTLGINNFNVRLILVDPSSSVNLL